MINNLVAGSFNSIEQAAGSIKRQNTDNKDNASNVSFQEIFNQKLSIEEAVDETSHKTGIRFSKHADTRLRQRDITLTEEQLLRLSEGTYKAGQKGIKESLVLLDNMAFIVNTSNNIVVTAMDQSMNDENIFTNIDGAVII